MAESTAKDSKEDDGRETDAQGRPADQPTYASLPPIIDFRLGEAIATFYILAELARHREPPFRICGSNLLGRSSIHVTLTQPIVDVDAAKGEYKGGRVRCVRGKCDVETEHFAYEWVAPRPVEDSE